MNVMRISYLIGAKLQHSSGFRVRKWLSNDRNVLAEIPEPKRASSVVNLDIEDFPTACALGLKWNVEADKFVWEVLAKVQRLLEEKPMTRREAVWSSSYAVPTLR